MPEDPWGYEGQMDHHAPVGDEDYWDNYPEPHKCKRGVACPEGCEAEPLDMYEPR